MMRFRTLGVFAVALLIVAAPSALATDYYADVNGGPWTSNTTWHLVSNSGPVAPAGTYPGSAPGDKAIIDFQGISVTVSTSIPNAVILDANNVSCFVIVTTGGTLPLIGSSQVAGGTILNLTGGTVNNGGTLTIGSTSSINWSTGTITGAGTTSISAGADLNATGSSMIVTGGQTINIFDTLTYGASASGLSVNSGAQIVVQSGGLFDVQNFNGIASDGLGGANITVNSGGTFLKSNGNFGTNINPTFNNNGTVQVNISSLGFAKGTHTGAFIMNGAGTSIGFPGTHTFSGATGSISGAGSAFFGGTIVISAGADLDISNVSNDSFSSISGNGTINLTGTFTWNASSISGITFNAQSGSTVNISGAGNTSIASAAHFNNAGTMTINPGATFSIVSDAHLTNNGTINIAGDLTINSDGAPLARIDNLATRSINKTAGAGAAYIAVKLNNAGSVSTLQGLLKLQQGGTHSGAWGLGTGAALVFDGGTHQLTGGSFTGSTGTLGLNAGTLDIDANITPASGITFQQSGGVLTGSGNFTIGSAFLWTGGTMNNSSGNGQTILTGTNSQIAGTTSTIVLSGRIISNTGTFTYNPTTGIELSIDDGGLFLNTGTFNWVGDAEMDSNQASTPGFTNGVGGTINKSTGTGVADMYPTFSNLSSINLTSGSIALHGGGSDLGTITFGSATNKIIIANGSFNLPDQPVLNGAGAVSVDGPFATLGITGTVTIPRLEILSGGTVAGGTLNIGTSLLWRNGKMAGGVTNIANTATVDATSLSGAITLDTHSLTNNGTITWDGSNTLQLINGSSLINNGTFTATGNGTIGGNAPANAITNNGTFEKTGGTSGTRIDPAFVNSGQLSSEVSGQSLIIAGGGSQTGGGSLVTVAGALIDFLAGTFTVPPGTSPFMGSGIFRVNGGTLSITGSTSVPSPAVMRVDSGTLNVAASSTFQTFGGLQWNGGTLAGDGTTRTFGGSIGNTAPKTLNNNHTLSIASGTVSYTGASPNQLTIGGTAALNIESSATLAMANGSAIAGTSTDGVTITGGTLDVSAGTAILGHGSMSSGAIATGASGVMNFSNGTFVMSGGSVTGSGTVAVQSSQTLTVNSAQTFPNLQLITGTLNGTGALTVNGGFWSGGTMSGTGTTTVTGPFAINSGSVKTLGRNLVNNSTITENDPITFSGAATLTNANTWNSLANIGMACSACTGKFDNNGTYTKGGAFVTHSVPFDNDGTLTINAGTQGLNLAGGGTHTGDFATASGNLHLGGTHTFLPTSDITGNGHVVFINNAVHQGTIVLGDASVNSLAIATGANVTFNTAAPVQAPRVSISGNVGGTGAIVANGPGNSTWFGGTISGTGAFTIGPGATMSINGASAHALDGRTITNNGLVTIATSVAVGVSGGSLQNSGTFRVPAPPNTITFAPTFTNTVAASVAEFLAGTTAFTGGYTQTDGLTKLAGGTFSSPLTVALNGGTLAGNGTITANVSNSGVISPGLSAGTLTVSGNLALGSTSVINSEIGGTAPGTGYDQLVVTGAATLDGTMNVTMINGFSPADNNVFDLVTWGSRTGAFATVNLPSFPAGSLNPTYEPNAFRVTADFVGDLSITKSGPPNAAVGQNISYTIIVNNGGPSAADSVTVNDPTPANLTFVSTSGDCTTAFPCALGSLAAGATKTIVATYTVTGGAGSNITNTATVTTTSTDNVTTNNTGSATTFVDLADMSITKTGPASAAFGDNVSFTINISNAGPSPAAGVIVSDPTPANMTFVSNSGHCTTAFPCSFGTINAGVTKTITATYKITGGAGSNITNTATVSTSTAESTTTNNSASATVFVELADLAITKSGPATAAAGSDISFTIVVANGGQSSANNVVVNDPTPAGLNFLSNSGDCTTAFPCSLGTVGSGTTKTIVATYSVAAGATGTSITNTASVTTSTTDDPANNTASATVEIDCINSTPTNLTPTGNAAGSGTLSWRGTGDSYVVYLGPAGSGCTTQFATTTSRSVNYSDLAPGTYEWRVKSLADNCESFTSSCATFTVAEATPECPVPAAPIVSVVGQTTSAKTYEVEWEAVTGAVRYEIEEANNPEFLGATRLTVTDLRQAYKHDVTEAAAFYYRVRAFVECTTVPGPYSTTVRVVIIPLPPKEQDNPSVNIPAGSEEVVVQTVFIPGQPGQNLFFTAETDRPWLTVRPQQGVLTPNGINLEVVADPKTLPNGTFTASIIVTITDGTSGRIGTNGTTVVTTPFSINLVTPVTPVAAKPATSQYALVIPTAGHLDGIDSHWQSDIRVTNAGFRSARYQLTFTPAGGTAQGVKQTNITVDAGATTALDDIIRNWFGLGTLNDGANGMLEIVPLDDPATTSLSTVASSRTYNVTGSGTLGQYIPAVPFPSFIGRALPNALPQVLSLQQIAQNSSYRTNVGLAEAGGGSVDAVLSVFNSAGSKLKDIPVSLTAGQQLQMNGLLATHGIELADGRIEVKVTGGNGKVTAYASVVDSKSQDPLLVSGTSLSAPGATKFVLPGVANIDNAVAQWRTDMRVFNYGTTSQPATLTFFPFNNGASKTAQVLLGAGQVMTLDNVLKSQFDTENVGGVVHLTTLQPASLVVTGRTYNETANGTLGQFVPAVTVDQAVAVNGRTLHILQVEDSTRYRTNLGLAEVSGKPATIEVQVVLPDSKVTPTVQIPLAANEFRQFNLIRELGVGNVYNARITVRVIGGEGRVTAYGSVIDEVTQDPTYVPAQ